MTSSSMSETPRELRNKGSRSAVPCPFPQYPAVPILGVPSYRKRRPNPTFSSTRRQPASTTSPATVPLHPLKHGRRYSHLSRNYRSAAALLPTPYQLRFAAPPLHRYLNTCHQRECSGRTRQHTCQSCGSPTQLACWQVC